MQLHTSAGTHSVAKEELPEVRLAVPEDVNSLVELGRELHADNGVMPFSEQRLYEFVVRAVKKDKMIAGVIGPIGHVEAMIFISIGCFWYTNFPHLEEMFAFVRPEYRRSNRAKALIEFAKQTADGLGVPLFIGIVSQQRTEAKIRLYRRQLGDPSGAFFIYNGKTGS